MHLESLASVLVKYRYWILIPLAFIEGPTVAFVTGTLIPAGYFNLYLVYGIFIVKDFVVDGLCYYSGRVAGERAFVKRLLTRAHVTSADLDHVRLLWHRHRWRTMCIAKLSWGLSPALLAVAGIVAVPVAVFFRCAVGIALVQYGVLLGLGYYFGDAIGGVSRAIRVIGFTFAAAVVVAMVYVRRRLRAA
jgi:membrane protein DedA with SNARE-associated domain